MDYIIKCSDHNENYISHHGIQGQKWGVRRFQNPDGSLTYEGKLRYNQVVSELTAGKYSKMGSGTIRKLHERAQDLDKEASDHVKEIEKEVYKTTKDKKFIEELKKETEGKTAYESQQIYKDKINEKTNHDEWKNKYKKRFDEWQNDARTVGEKFYNEYKNVEIYTRDKKNRYSKMSKEDFDKVLFEGYRLVTGDEYVQNVLNNLYDEKTSNAITEGLMYIWDSNYSDRPKFLDKWESE